MIRALSILGVVIAAIIGFAFRDDPFRLRQEGMPADQLALAHRDSPYSHVTWVASEDSNYLQLRFFDKVEGGACLRPSWDELAELAPETLGHLRMPADYPVGEPPAGREWPDDLPKPNPGTLSNTRYINLYPTAVLLNQRLMAEAGGDWRAAKPDILIVGLGSGIGASFYAHHFPEASITVVDIDQVVIDMVRDHYPLLRWLEDGQETSDGRQRLDFVRCDARQFLIFPNLRTHQRDYDIVVLDAYTTGSTIPPHLMTEEFFRDVAGVMPDDGILLSNIIGSYTGSKRQVLGGAMRSMRAGGLSYVHNFPILYPQHGERQARFEPGTEGALARNNIVLASASPLDPSRNTAGWESLSSFISEGGPYPDLPLRRFRTMTVALQDQSDITSFYGILEADGRTPIDGDVFADLDEAWGDQPWTGTLLRVDDRQLVRATRDAVLAHAAQQPYVEVPEWADFEGESLRLQCTDWVLHGRQVLASSAEIAERGKRGDYLHSGEALVGPEGEERAAIEEPYWTIRDAPVFTDAKPNADILNL